MIDLAADPSRTMKMPSKAPRCDISYLSSIKRMPFQDFLPEFSQTARFLALITVTYRPSFRLDKYETRW